MKKGTAVKGHERTYIIERELGSGATSQVYLATIQGQEQAARVALKVLRPDVGKEIRKSFFLEADILRELYAAEEQFDGRHAIPRLYETWRDSDPCFLAQELVPGRSLETWLGQPPYYLEEPVALQITAQVARVLHLLHTKLKRSYTDFQLKNIYFDESTRQVRIIDWNHVSAPDQGTPDVDLTLLGVSLYQMLTGKLAFERGESEHALERRAGERWQALSLGCRQIVVKALHPNPQRRFAPASEILNATDWLTQKWTQEVGKLLTEIYSYLNDAPQHEDILFLESNIEYARILLSLARQRGGAPEESLNQLEQKINERDPGRGDPLQAGRTFYEAGDYKAAKERWQTLAQEKGQLKYWRWVQAAHAGVENGPAFTRVRPQVDEAIRWLEEEEYDRAQQQIQQLQQQSVGFAPLRAIQAELKARQLIQEVDSLEEQARSANSNGKFDEATQHYEKAAQNYDEAERQLQSIP